LSAKVEVEAKNDELEIEIHAIHERLKESKQNNATQK